MSFFIACPSMLLLAMHYWNNTGLFRHFLLVSLWSLLLPSALYAGGGWLSRKGGGFLKLNQGILRARHYFTPAGSTIPITTTSLYTSSLYAEYGINSRLQGMAYVPFFSRVTLNRQVSSASKKEVVPGDFLNTIGDIDVGLKVGLSQKTKIKVAASLIFGLPTGNASGGDTRLLQTGDGEFNQLFLLEASYSLHPLPIFFSAGTGLNVRSRNFSEEFRYYLQSGMRLHRMLHFICQLSGTESFYNGSPKGVANSIFSNNTEYLSAEPGVLLGLHKNMGVSASVTVPFIGRQVLSTPQYNIGLYASW